MKKMSEMNLAELKERLLEIIRLKNQALKDQQYETGAKLRDEERQCGEAINRLEKEE